MKRSFLSYIAVWFLISYLSFGFLTPTIFGSGYQKPTLGRKINWAHPLSKRLVGLWLFNEGAGNLVNDSSRYRNHGTNNGATWSPSKFGGGLSFNGSSNYVVVSDSSSLLPTGAWTIEIWFKPNTLSGFTGLIQKGVLVDQYNTLLIAQNSDYIMLLSSSNGTSWDINISSVAKVTVDTWTHIVCTFDGSSITKLYFNGKYDGQDTSAIAFTDTANALHIGVRKYSLGWQYFNGLIDNVSIYNQALSPSEINHLYYEPFFMFEPSMKVQFFKSILPQVIIIISKLKEKKIDDKIQLAPSNTLFDLSLGLLSGKVVQTFNSTIRN